MLTEVVDQNPSNHGSTSSAQPQVQALQYSLCRRPQLRRHGRAQVRDAGCPDSCMCDTCRNRHQQEHQGHRGQHNIWATALTSWSTTREKLQKPSSDKWLWSTNWLLVMWYWQPSHREAGQPSHRETGQVLLQSLSKALSPSKMTSVLFWRHSP